MSVMRTRGIIAFILVPAIGGCASTQLNQNTLDIAGSYDSLLTRQVINNIEKTISNPYGIPSIVKVTAQTATTTNSVTPSYTTPFTAAITAMAGGRTYSRAGAGFGIGLSDQWTQSSTINPVYDTDQLRRLALLFQYVTRTAGVDENTLEVVYPLIEAGKPKPVQPEKPGGKRQSSSDGVIFVRKVYLVDKDGNFKGFGYQAVDPDETFIKPPGCILCDYGRPLKIDDALYDQDTRDKVSRATLARTRVLVKNNLLTNDWLYKPGEERPSDAVPIPEQGAGQLYVKGNKGGIKDYGAQSFYEFVLLTEDAASQGTGSPASGGQSNGRKTTPIERVSIPVSGSTFVP